MKKSSKIRGKYDVKDIARLLGVTYLCACQMCREGKIRAVKIGQKYYIAKRDFDLYVNSGNVFNKPEKIIIETIRQGLTEAMERNLERIILKVKELLIEEIEKKIKRNLEKIAENNERFKKLLPVKVVKQLKDRENGIKKEFEKVK